MIKEVKLSELSTEYLSLLREAENVMHTAYNPYSNFFVGAALLYPDGTIAASASNTENAAFGSTICAERNALGAANAKGKREYAAIAIIGKGKDFDTTGVVSPCGSCRQSIYEVKDVSGIRLDVIMSNTKKDKIVIATIDDPLPMAFGPSSLGIDVSRFRGSG